MQQQIDPAARDQWYCLGVYDAVPPGRSRTRLMDETLVLDRAEGQVALHCGSHAVAHRIAHGHLWATLGTPAGDVPAIPEAHEPDRRYVPCGPVLVRASGPRIVENFLDLAHFPFVHTDILGAEPHTEVPRYDCEIRRDVGEIWATDCRFRQPRAALSAEGAIDTSYVYRVASPLVTMLYKTSPGHADRWDVIALFVQPLAPDLCRVHPVMFLLDAVSTQSDLICFQQTIFLQDRIILENQRPRLLPLEPRAETPTRADATSVAYRRWLKETDFRYGTTAGTGLENGPSEGLA